jgi:hypothetical protein
VKRKELRNSKKFQMIFEAQQMSQSEVAQASVEP